MTDAPRSRDSVVLIEREMRDSYLSYAMSVIVSRALPDVRDGLKPSQRRVLVAMNDLNLGPRSRFKKCAKIAGDTSGNYHPHGEGVVYPTLVRLAQPFNMRATLVDGQGNFGSVDGDPPAAMRYTEARMTAAASVLLDDLDQHTVDFIPNYDGSRTEPTVLPGAFPNLLINGSNGIAVGMATSMPPHNPGEIFAALKLLIADPDATIEDLMELVPGPDFPTGGILCGQTGIKRAYMDGRGTVLLRCRAECVEEAPKQRAKIVITEIPYQVNKSTLVEVIAQLVKDQRVTSIYDVVDLSDRKGMNLVIEMKKGEDPYITLNQLYKFTQLQNTVSIINIALVASRPQTLSLKRLMSEFLDHRRVVIRRRTEYQLGVARDRQHIVEGLRIAQDNIDEVIRIIRAANNTEEAKAELCQAFKLSDRQSEAIVNMRLRALTSLEVDKLEQEWKDLAEKIARFEAILANPRLIDEIIEGDLDRLAERFNDPRRTEIGPPIEGFEDEDFIVDETVAVTISNKGYTKRMTLDNYRSQRRGGSGIRGSEAKDDDFLERLFIADTHDSLLFFTASGKLHQLKVYRLPALSRTANGRAIVNLLPNFPPEDRIQAVIPVRNFDEGTLVFSTARGVIKRTPLSAYKRPKAGGIIAINLDDDDRLIDVAVCSDDDEVILGTRAGKSIRFALTNVRTVGRASRGVRGIKLLGEDSVCGMAVVRDDTKLLTVSENGYGKRTPFEDYPVRNRGGQGVINMRASERNGPIVSVRAIAEGDDVMTITAAGQVVRTRAAEISSMGRATNGVRVISVKKGDKLASIARVPPDDSTDDDELDGDGASPDGAQSSAPQDPSSGDASNADSTGPGAGTPDTDPPERS